MTAANANDHPVLSAVAPIVADMDPAALRCLIGLAAGLLMHATSNREARRAILNIAAAMPRDDMTPAERVRFRIAEIAAEHGFTYAEVVGPSRSAEVSRCRQRCIWTLRHETNYSWPQLARHFKRDHSTLIYNATKYESELAASGEPFVPLLSRRAFSSNRLWTEGEDAILRRFYPIHSNKVIAREMTAGGLPRSDKAVRTRLKRLGLRRRYGCSQDHPADLMAAE